MRAVVAILHTNRATGAHERTSIEWREKYAKKPMRHTIPSTRNIADAAVGVHTLISIRCIRSSARDAAECIIFPLQIGKQNDVASTLSHPKVLLASAHQSNRMLVHIAQDVLIRQNKISFGSQQLQFQLMFLAWLLPFTLFIIRAHSWPFSFDSRFKCRMILLLQNVTPRGVNFARHLTALQFIFLLPPLLLLDAVAIEQFQLASIEIVRHDLFIQTWTLRFNLNGFSAPSPSTWKKNKNKTQMRAGRPNGMHTMPLHHQRGPHK